VPLPDPNNPGFFIVSGKNRIRGFETELKGYVSGDWQTSLGYAYTDARISSDTSTAIVKGNRIQLVPFSQFSWCNKYQFTPVWSAALGTIYFSNSYASSDDTVRLPRFVRFDGAIYAQITPTWKVELNVENILNPIGRRRTGTIISRQARRAPFARPPSSDFETNDPMRRDRRVSGC
jgi:catecholate siderophore receptor